MPTNTTIEIAIKAVYGPSRRKLCPIEDNNGNLIKEEEGIKSRWREHYSNILNHDTTANHDILQEIPQYPCFNDLDKPLSITKIKTAVKQLRNNKSPGCDEIPAGIFKALGDNVCIHLKDLFDRILETGTVPQDFSDALLVNLYKNKGNASDCGNYRGIALLSVDGKVLTKAMANRLTSVLEKILPEAQSGFRPNRGTSDAIFPLGQLEKALEQQDSIYIIENLPNHFQRALKSARGVF